MLDDQPPSTVITHVIPEDGRIIVRGMTADHSPVQKVTVNGRRAYSLRDNFAEWEVTLDAPAAGQALELSASAIDAGRRAEKTAHHLKYRSPEAAGIAASRP